MWRLAIATWRTSPGRALAVTISVALGVGAIVTITSFYETARRGVAVQVVHRWLGSAHLTLHPQGAHWAAIDEALANSVAPLENVRHVTARLRRRARLVPLKDADRLLESTWLWIDAVGIRPETEREFHTLPKLTGRMIRPGEHGVAVMERDAAGRWGVDVGSAIMMTPHAGGPKITLTIVGLFDTRRIAIFQLPNVYMPLADLQDLLNEPGAVSAIDVMLDDPSPASIAKAKLAIEANIAPTDGARNVRIETAEGRQMLLSEAERITRLILMLIAFVAMLTSFFIIVATQTVSLHQRCMQLGVMRCVGMTRTQLATLMLMELMPLGLVGTVLGILLGILASRIAAHIGMEGSLQVFLSPWGIGLAAISGLATTLIGALFLILQVGRVTPLEAVAPQARPARMRYVYISSLAGVALLAVHQWMVAAPEATQWLHSTFAMAGAASLYFGYMLVTPGIVVLLGRPVARMVGRLLGLRAQLADDAFQRAPWRTTGACWVLMVGLSLIVYIAIGAESILSVWDFPGRLPEAFVWTQKYVSGETIEEVRRIPGVRSSTTTTDVACKLAVRSDEPESKQPSIVERFLRKLTRPVFVAGDPGELLRMIKVAFVEGDRDEAVEKLERGGYVLIPPQTARNMDLHVGDEVTVTIGNVSVDFEVAGVIQSPAMDLAVTAFQADSYMQIAAASAVLGTRQDLIEKFGLDVVSMFMCDVDLPVTDPPKSFDPANLPNHLENRDLLRAVLSWRHALPNEGDRIDRLGPAIESWLASGSESDLPEGLATELRRFARALQWLHWDSQTPHRTRAQNWEAFRERLVLLRIGDVMERPDAVMGSMRRLTQLVEKSLRRAIAVITFLPSMLLVAAAIGIGNLMTVSVHQRSRQLAVLRAVGAFRSQIVRIVLAEAITLGLLGSVMGVALGIHTAHSDNRIVAALIHVRLEFIIPYSAIAIGVAVTVAVCVLAGIVPARYAARDNILAAIHTT